jgi:predicted nucleic acid-binding protein
MGWQDFWCRIAKTDPVVILVDTSIIVAWLDPSHPEHEICVRALDDYAGKDQMAVSSVTYAELAAGGRTREAMDEDLRIFSRVELSFEAAFRAGVAFGRFHPGKRKTKAVLPDFLIRGQAAVLNLRHLTNDRQNIAAFPDVEFIFPE